MPAGADSEGMTTISLRGPADVLTVLPYQLGYHPREAVVVVALHGRTVGLVERIDLPPPDQVTGAAEALTAPLVAQDVCAVLLVGYESSAAQSALLLDAVRDALEQVGIDVLHRLVVREGRWYAPDGDPEDCPPEGLPLPSPDRVPAVADFVALGVAPLPDRAALAPVVAADARAGRGVASALRSVLQTPPTGPRAARRLEGLAAWAVVCDVSPQAPDPSRLTSRQIATAVAALADLELRDGLVAWLCPGALPLDCLGEDVVDALTATLGAPPADPAVARRLLARLQHLARAVPDPHAAGVLTILANLAWWLGDGTMARTALDRALEHTPDYRLAVLLEQMVDLGVRPGRDGSRTA